MQKKIFYILLLVFVFLNILSPICLCDDLNDETIDVNAEIIENTSIKETEITLPKNINSRAYVVIDRNSNSILYGKNENQKKKMASTTKIMTATIILEHCNLTETIEISKKAAGTGGSRLGLKVGDKITVRDLLYGLMLCSGNDAAVT